MHLFIFSSFVEVVVSSAPAGAPHSIPSVFSLTWRMITFKILSLAQREPQISPSPQHHESPSCCLAETSGTGCGVVTPSIGRYGRRHTALEDDAATTTTRPATRGPIALGLQSMRAGTAAALEPVLRRLPDHDAGSQGRRHDGHHRDGARDAQGGPRLGVRPAHR